MARKGTKSEALDTSKDVQLPQTDPETEQNAAASSADDLSSQTETADTEFSPGDGVDSGHELQNDAAHQSDSEEADIPPGGEVPVIQDDASDQTGIDGSEDLPGAGAVPAKNEPVPQTDLEDEHIQEDQGPGASSFGDKMANVHTDTETSPDDPEGAADVHVPEGIPQTDSETDGIPESPAADLQVTPEETASGQTDPEVGAGDGEMHVPRSKKPASPKTRKKTSKSAVSAEEAPAGTQIRTKKNAFPSGSDEAAAESKQAQRAARQPSSGQSSLSLRSIRDSGPSIVSIDNERSVESDTDKKRNALLDLVESMKGRKILSGTIQGVERSEDDPDLSFAVVYHGDFKVIIPADEAVDRPADFRGREPGDVMHYLLTKRLGAEIDYIIKGTDPETGMAAASRREAMAQKRRDYYFGTDREGYNLMYEGVIAEARVISVIRAGIFVEVFGAECYIALRELSYQRWLDAAAHMQPGQRVLVKILGINREDRNNIRITASVKQAGEDPYEKALRRYSVGNRYVGSVSVVDTTGVFVSLDGGIDCLCSYPKRGRPPRGSRVTVRILGINNETNRIWGAITHMTTAR